MKIFFRLSEIKELFRALGISPDKFMLPVAISLVASLFEGISIGSLIPMLKGVINMDFSFVKQSAVFKLALNMFPKLTGISNTAIFILLLGVIFSAAVLKSVLQYISVMIMCYQVRQGSRLRRNDIFEHYLSFGKMFFDRNNLGYLYNVLINYTSLIADRVREIGFVFCESFLICVYAVLMFVISWKITLLVVILYPVLNKIFKLAILKIKETSKSYEIYLGEISKKISNILSCMPLVKLYTRDKKENENFCAISKQIQEAEFSLDKKYILVDPMHEIFFMLVILLIVSATAFILVNEKSREVLGFFVFILLLRKSQNSLLKINKFLASLAVIKGPLDAVSKMLNDADKFIITDGKIEFTGLRSNIELKELNFSYFKDQPVLKAISFSVEKSKVTALVGPSGAGKTTLINLILRFYDCPPSTIMIDGKDIRDFTFKSLMSHMALVSQDTLLFNDTIRNNIIYGLDIEIPGQKLADVIKKARLDDFIAGLRNGVDTYIGERGIMLSGGERQRVSIARALLKGSEILILDEATSSLDTKTERLIQEAMDEAIKDRTAIVIAHRLSTIKNAHKIIFIDDGRVIEEGPLDELLREKGRFYEAWQEQKFY